MTHDEYWRAAALNSRIISSILSRLPEATTLAAPATALPSAPAAAGARADEAPLPSTARYEAGSSVGAREEENFSIEKGECRSAEPRLPTFYRKI